MSVGLGFETVAPGEGVVEVAPLGAHAADVERGHGPGELAQVLEAVADRHQSPGGDFERPQLGRALGGHRQPERRPTRPWPARG